MMAIRRGARLPTLDFWIIALAIVVLAALALRLYSIDWDDGADLHPDELFVAKIALIDRIRFDWPADFGQLIDPARSGLNPRSVDPTTGEFREFAYGALPLWVTDASAWVLSRLTGTNWNAMDRAYLVGRAISAVLSALTILPIAALGSSIGGRSVGLLAALFAALAPMSIQLAHFFTTDSWLTFFVALCLLASVNAAQLGEMNRFALAGATFGLAMATKGSVFALVVPIAAALIVDTLRRFRHDDEFLALKAALANSFAAAIASLATFFAFEPFALFRPGVYFQSLRTQADIVSGAFDVPFTRVYSGTVPLLYQLEQFLRWGYGPTAGLLSIAGSVLIVALALRHQSLAALVLASWLVVYGAVLLVADVKFLRYLEPLAPVFAVGAALALQRLTGVARRVWPRAPSNVIPLLCLLLTAAWTGAFLSLYAHENSRLAATRWIYGAIPPGSTLTTEYWDDALPRSLAYSLSPSIFGLSSITLDLYRDLPPADASDAIYAGISRADYIIQSSQRVESAMFAAPWRYPVQGRYFSKLKDGGLGFARVASFERSPTIGNLAIDDQTADESFINYDHPRVAIYALEESLTRKSYDEVMSWALQRPWNPAREAPEPTLLLGHPVGENPSVNDARWSEAVTSATPAAIGVWILLLGALLAVGLPIARLLLPTFPDQGWGLARVLAVAIAANPVWLGASLDLFRFRAIWVVVSIATLGLVSWWLSVRAGWTFVRVFREAPSHAWIHAEAAFWLVFLLFLTFRLINPDSWHPFWGGEKPMEFAQINAISRSAFFPPYDPWYADGYVNYYYYGFYLMAFLFKATGIPAEIGFNLALPTLMGLLASGGFAVAAALARGLTRSSGMAVVGGWSGTVALCLLGNLSALRSLADGASGRIDPFLYWTWRGSRAIDNVITEFPFFTGLYADLHAHVIALPLTVAVIAVCMAVATSPIFDKPIKSSQIERIPLPAVMRLAVLALLIGSLSATNAWDVPVYAALALASIIMATRNVAPIGRQLFILTGCTIFVLGGAWLLFLPFHLSFVPLFGHVALVQDPTDLLQFLSHLGGLVVVCSLGLAVLLLRGARENRPMNSWPMVLLAAGVLGAIAITSRPGVLGQTAGSLLLVGSLVSPPVAAAWHFAFNDGRGRGWERTLTLLVPPTLSLVAIAGVLQGRAVFGLLVALGGAAAVGWLRLRRRTERFICLLLAAGLLTAAGVEILVVADDLIGTTAYRMNTVFKFYNQVWVLLSLAASALIALMLLEILRHISVRQSVRPALTSRLTWSRLGVTLTVVLVLAALTYPLLATVPRLAQRFTPGTQAGTLNAFSWMDSGTVPVLGDSEYFEIAFAGDAAAIAWIFDNVSGSPVVAEASIGPYRCNGSRISSATGLPTIIGWERHEQQQRYRDTLPARVDAVRTLYTSADPEEKAAILRRYNVEYVVVGDLERLYPVANNECTPTGSAAGIAAFDAMLGTTLEIAHSAKGTTIYRVLSVRTD